MTIVGPKDADSNYPDCGCTATTVVCTAPDNCADCIKAWDIQTLCKNFPGSSFSVNIFDLAKSTQDPTTRIELKDFDKSGFESVVILTDGTVNVTYKDVYTKGKKYWIDYRISEIEGIKSRSGRLYLCMADQCDGEPGCNPLNGDVVVMDSMQADATCDSTVVFDISGWDYDQIFISDDYNACIDQVAKVDETIVVVLSNTCIRNTDLKISVLGEKDTARQIVDLTVSITNPCAGVDSFDCDPCTGELGPLPDLEITDGENPDLEIV